MNITRTMVHLKTGQEKGIIRDHKNLKIISKAGNHSD